MSARSKARKQALDLLYESDIRGSDALEILRTRDIPDDGPDARPIREYTRDLIGGVSENRRKIDELIRLGIFEILCITDVPVSVAIDEALNLAKELSSDESSKYIHGVLGRIASLKDSISI